MWQCVTVQQVIYTLLPVSALNRKRIYFYEYMRETLVVQSFVCHRLWPVLSSNSGNLKWNCQGHKTPDLAPVTAGLHLWHIFIQAWPRLLCFPEKLRHTVCQCHGLESVCVHLCVTVHAIYLCKGGKKNSGCGRKKVVWKSEPVYACVVCLGFQRLYERLRLRVLDLPTKHHFLFAG